MDEDLNLKIYNALESISKDTDAMDMIKYFPLIKQIFDLYGKQKECIKKYRALGYNAEQIEEELKKL